MRVLKGNCAIIHILSLLSIFVGIFPSLVYSEAWEDEFNFTNDDYYDHEPAVADDDEGYIHLVYVKNQAGMNNIEYSLYDPWRDEWTTENVYSGLYLLEKADIAVMMGEENVPFIVWSEDDQVEFSKNIYIIYKNMDGSWSQPQRLNSPSDQNSSPQIVVAHNNETGEAFVIVVWEGPNPGNSVFDIYSSAGEVIVNADGKISIDWGQEGYVVPGCSNDYEDSCPSMDAWYYSYPYLVWHQVGSYGEEMIVGNYWDWKTDDWGDWTVSGWRSGGMELVEGYFAYPSKEPSLYCDKNSEKAWCAWQMYNPDPENEYYYIFATYKTGIGAGWFIYDEDPLNVCVDSSTVMELEKPSIYMDKDDRAHCVWMKNLDPRGMPDNFEIFHGIYENESWSDPQMINRPDPNLNDLEPFLSDDGTENLFCFWYGDDISEGDTEIFYNVYDMIPPKVTITSPEDDEDDVAVNKDITIAFSEAIDIETVIPTTDTVQGTLRIEGSRGGIYAWNKEDSTYNEQYRYIIIPVEGGFLHNEDITVTVGPGIDDDYENPMTDHYEFRFTTAEGTLLEKSLVYTYPNPAPSAQYADNLYFHIYITKPAEVIIDVYNINGKNIASFNETYSVQGEQVLEWNLEAIASEVYVYKVVANALDGSETATVVKKLAIVK